MACEAPKTWKFTVFSCFWGPEGFQTINERSQNDALWGPARITAINNNLTSANMWVFAILLWWRILNRHASTNRRRYAQKRLHRPAFMRRHYILHREGRANWNFYMQTPYTQKLSRQKKYTKTFTHRCFAQRCFCTHKCRIIKAHRRFYTQNLLHGEPLHKETFTQKKWHRKTCTHRLRKKTITHRNFCMQKHYSEQLFHIFFPHRNFSAQKPFLHRNLYVQRFLHRCFYTQTHK